MKKNLRKALVVVLVLAMVFSISAIGVSAAFTDTATTKYGEAIDVLAAIGVINGTTSTTFEPTGSLTRESAAKIIAYLMLGPTNAGLISGASSQRFADVATNRWSAGYIEYCASANIVTGDGNGNFNPTAPLTTAAFTKMLLCALGYKADVEYLTGSSWAINTASLAVTAGVYDSGIAISASTTCTREQAAQLAFKALKATLVQYTGGTSIKIGDSTITTGATRSSVENKSTTYTDADTTYTTVGTMQFAEKYFTDLALRASVTDGFGRPAHKWVNSGTTIGTYKDAPVISYNGAKTATTIASDLSAYSLADATATPVYYSVDNITAVSYTGASNVKVTNGTTSALSAVSQTTADLLSKETGNGKLVEIYADNNKHITKVVEIVYTVGTISDIVTTSDRTTYTLKSEGGTFSSGIDYVSASVADTISGQTGMAKGDTITYAATAGGVTFVYPTTKVVGTATGFNVVSPSTSTVTVSGTTYTIAKLVTDVSTFAVSSTAANYFLDQFGYAVKTSATAASTNYAFLLSKYGTLATDVNGNVPSAQVKAVKADGTVAVYTLSLTKVTPSNAKFGTTAANGGIVFAADDYYITGTNICAYDASWGSGATAAANVNTAVGTMADVYGYTLDTAGTTISVQTLTPASGTMAPGSVNYDSNVDALGYGVTSRPGSSGDTVLLSSSTVYVVYSSVTGTATLYTGSMGLPASTFSGGVGTLDGNRVVMTANTGTAGTASYVFKTVTNPLTSAATNYAYIVNTSYGLSQNSSGGNVYTYAATKSDGTKVNLTYTSSTNLANGGIYNYDANNSIDSSSTPVATTSTTTLAPNSVFLYGGTLTVVGSLLGNSSTSVYYNITSTTKTVFIDTTKGTVNGNKGYIVLAKSNGVPTSDIDTIYIVG